MTHHNEGELKLVVQALLAVFISYTLLRFLFVFSVNFSGVVAFGVIIGAAILYLGLRRSNEFDTFIGMTCFMAIPFSILFSFIA